MEWVEENSPTSNMFVSMDQWNDFCNVTNQEASFFIYLRITLKEPDIVNEKIKKEEDLDSARKHFQCPCAVSYLSFLVQIAMLSQKAIDKKKKTPSFYLKIKVKETQWTMLTPNW